MDYHYKVILIQLNHTILCFFGYLCKSKAMCSLLTYIHPLKIKIRMILIISFFFFFEKPLVFKFSMDTTQNILLLSWTYRTMMMMLFVLHCSMKGKDISLSLYILLISPSLLATAHSSSFARIWVHTFQFFGFSSKHAINSSVGSLHFSFICWNVLYVHASNFPYIPKFYEE